MTKIEWARAGLGRGETWNPIRANNDLMGDPTRIGWHCEKVSPACEHCYAERQNLAGARGGTRYPYKPASRANGRIQVFLDEKTLLTPLRWKAPRGIFACSMTDIFGDWVETEWLDKIFAVAALCPQHIFIFLTKRPQRMRAYMAPFDQRRADGLGNAVISLGYEGPLESLRWPLPNVWLGVTAEDQQRADERIPDLLATPATVRFVSCEPLLGMIDLKMWMGEAICGSTHVAVGEDFERCDLTGAPCEGVDWIIAGGESGPGARPSHPDWFRALRDQCAGAGVPFFFKQWGEWHTCAYRVSDSQPVFRIFDTFQRWVDKASTWINGGICLDRAGRDLKVGADFMRARDDGTFPITIMHRVGKNRAGRLLDGREHNEFPETRR